MPEQINFTTAVVACLIANDPNRLEPHQNALTTLVAHVLDEVPKDQKDVRWSAQPSNQEIQLYQQQIRAILPEECDKIALIAGGATKIKGYVFEAPKLPEIRGASALLDWVNEIELPKIWGAESSDQYAKKGIIYSSGGGFLAFAPAKLGEERAAAIEQCYTKHTLTANSVAVSKNFSLLELRYGRLSLKEDQTIYWITDFLAQWNKPALRAQLAEYYYGSDTDTPAERFYRRKTFGELVTLLSTMTNRRREERASHGDIRSIPFYQQLPWAEKCDGSDVRPAVVTTLVGIDQRVLSEASGRKLVAGRVAKGNVYKFTDLEHNLDWVVPANLISWGQSMSWERRWETYISNEGKESFYAKKAAQKNIRPAKDVHEISAASNGYIGIIYADGNNVGRLIATLTTPERYAKTSCVLSNAARLAVFQALADSIEPIESPPDDNAKPFLYPFEILTIGGDDLFIIVPANKAFDIARKIGQNFEQQIAKDSNIVQLIQQPLQSTHDACGRYGADSSFTNANYTPFIGLSAGVIIAQETAPIFFLRDLVEELLKSAKKLAKSNTKQGFYGGAIDFMVMKSITMVTDKIKSFRQQALGDNGEDSKRRLTARPYTWHEFAGLLDTVRALKKADVPRSQLYRLRRALDEQPGNAITPSVMEYLYTRIRLQSRYSDALQQHIDQHWCWNTQIPQRQGGLPPWMPLSKHGWETIWPDMLEAYEMVPEIIEEQQ